MSELIDVPALTLKNPWAHLVAHHGKNVENRSWMPPEYVDRLLIHAGKSWDDGWCGSVQAIGGLVTSAIVAVADLAHACDSSRDGGELRCGCGEWAMPGQCHWVLANVRALPWPVPCSGRQKLWRPAAGVLAQVNEQLAHPGVSGV